jgi:hypothetical protein
MQHGVIDQLSFGFRANGLRLRRLCRDLRNRPSRLARCQVEEALDPDWALIAGSSQAPLWPSAAAAEYRLTAGKIQNLRLAVRRLNGLRIPAGTVFSFWRHVGRPLRARGFVAGRELREGCMIASIGGGLCQLSNGLYAAARAANCEIIERHRHSQVIPGSLAEQDLDATVFWNYVDLRFRVPRDMLLEAILTTTDLVVRLRGKADGAPAERGNIPPQAPVKSPAAVPSAAPGDCLACGDSSCVFHIRADNGEHGTAWLLDAYWPEFDHWLQCNHLSPDLFHLPLDGRVWRRPQYAWHLPAQNRRYSHPFLTLMQAAKLRRLSTQGAARQHALLERDRRLASAYASNLAYETGQLVVAQNLLPHLWESGALGGRNYAVLMTRAPLTDLQEALDHAACLHPLSPTLRDFRAPARLLAAEQSALQSARRFITPHSELADKLTAKYGGRVECVAWHLPQPSASLTAHPPVSPMASPEQRGEDDRARRRLLLFAGASLARKGAYEMRAVARHLPIRLRLPEGAMEAADFWHGTDTERPRPDCDPLVGVDCVVLPAFVEHQPRLLLRAVARGIPVICSRACGLGNHPGVTIIEAGDAAALAAAIKIVITAPQDAMVPSAADTRISTIPAEATPRPGNRR